MSTSRNAALARCAGRAGPGHPRQTGAVRLALACLLARGHLLIEDVPGVGKTTLAHALAHVLGLAWQRVQFTSDLLPADIIGVSVFDASSGGSTFRKGPMFTQLLLADEVNRASPKTQSALLEAMEERQVSVDVTTYRLPDPFFVVATQNPFEQLGTFRLPESQLDRFLMRISLGYPDAAHERALLAEGDRRDLLAGMPPALNPEACASCRRPRSACTWRQRCSNTCRRCSPARAGAATSRSACRRAPDRDWCVRRAPGRCSRAATWTLPEDVQAVFAAVASHRLGERGRHDGRRPRGVRRRDRARRAGSDLGVGVGRREQRRAADGLWPCASASRPGPGAARARIACPVSIVTRRIYILPTRGGFAFAALLFVMLLAGLNYANSIAHADHLPAGRLRR